MEYALITGASRGIGRAIAIRLAQNGLSVIINYHSNDEEALKTCTTITEAGGVAELLKFDVSNHDDCVHTLTKWQTSHSNDYISVLVNNAGIRHDELMVFQEAPNST